MTDLEDLLTGLLDWDSGRHVALKGQDYLVFTATDLPKDFWDVWRDQKDEIKALGLSVYKNDDDEFEAKWWKTVDTPAGQPEPSAERTNVQWNWAEIAHGCDWAAELPAQLKSYQLAAWGTLMLSIAYGNRFVLDASETGLGKTYTSLAVAKAIGWDVGIICPANVCNKWADTAIDAFGLEPVFIHSFNKARAGIDGCIHRREVHSKSKSRNARLNYTFLGTKPLFLIVDEVHECAGIDSSHAKLLQAAIRDPDIITLGLSATAALSVLSLDVIGEGLGLHFGNWWDWCLANGARAGFFGGLTFSGKPGTRGFAALNRIHRQIFPAKGVRLRRADLGADLPDVERCVEYYKPAQASWLLPSMLAIQDRLKSDVAKAESEGYPCTSEKMRARQESEISLLPLWLDKITSCVAEGLSTPAFFNFTGSIDCLSAKLTELKIDHGVYSGHVAEAQRRRDLERFQAGTLQVLLVQNEAGSASIDMHDVVGGHPRVSLHSPGYNPRSFIQQLGRTDRIGSKSKSTQLIYLEDSKSGRRIGRRIQSKLNNISMINDGDLSDINL